MEEEIIYFYNVKDGKYYQSRYTHRWLNNLQHQCKKQKEVIDKTIEKLECDDVDDEEMKGYLIQRIDTFKEILQKYKSIIGVSDEKEN